MPPLKKRTQTAGSTKPLRASIKKPKPRKESTGKHRLTDNCESVGITFSDWIVPGTQVRVDSTKQLVKENPICTVMPDGLHVSWGNCGRCMQRATNCQCKAVMHPPSVEWIYVNILLQMAGVESHVGSSGNVDSTHHEVSSRGLFWYARKRPGVVSDGWLADSKPNRPQPLSKRATFPSKPSKTASRPKPLAKRSKSASGSHKPVQDNTPVPDLKQVDKHAERSRDELLNEAMDRLSKLDKPKKKSGAKPLRKKGR